MASLIVRLHTSRKKTETIQLCIPFHLYNMIQFISPKTNSDKFSKITDWHYCCNGILTNPHYLTDFFPNVKRNGAMFSLRAELNHNFA